MTRSINVARSLLMATTGYAAMLATPVAAQEETPSDEAEIVVTAQKRSERLIDVPAAISVIGARQLENSKASQLTDIAAYVPGLQVDSGGTPGQTTISLRGIAPLDANATVGTYIDEAPVGSSSLYARGAGFAADLLPYDVERIEVLKGPQGTLYGASSIGGLLKYVTKSPDLNDVEVRMGADLFSISGSDGVGYSGRAGINLPIVSDVLAVRGSYAYQHTPGYIDNVVTGRKDVNTYSQQSARLSLLWQASETLSLKLAGMWQSVDATESGKISSPIPDGFAASTQQIPPLVSRGGLTNNNRIPESFETNLYYLTATLDWDVNFANLVAASSYAHTKTALRSDASDLYGALFPEFGQPAGLARLDVGINLDKFTQELRLTSPGGSALKWMLGGFYTYEKSSNKQNVTALDRNAGPVPALEPFAAAELPTTYREYAVFGELRYTFADALELSGGLRWARNDQSFHQITGGLLLPTANLPGKSAEDVWTYSASGRYKIDRRASVYVRVASGYRPGGPNVAFPDVPPMVSSDTLVNYEIGAKAELMDGALSLEGALFLMDWNKIQLNVSRNGITFSDNGGKARSKGFELSAVIRPTPGLSIGLIAAYTDARLREDASPVDGLKGARLPLVPQFSSSVALNYETHVGGSWKGSAGLNMRFVSDRYSEVDSAPNSIKVPDYVAFDANLGLNNGRWGLRLFAKNLTDSRGILSASMVTSGLGERVQVGSFPIQPRTIGIAADINF